MALLNVTNLGKSYGADVIFAGVSFEIQENDRVGLVGVNGSGKTTLFKLLTGELAEHDGGVVKSGTAVVGYMEQHVCKDLHRSALSEVLTIFTPLLEMEQELEELSHRLHAGAHDEDLDTLVARQALLTEQFARDGGLTCRARARSALLGLGFDDAQAAQSIGTLSGGQKAKLQLAKLLLSGANLLLLDEPTNHLDIDSVEWLEDFLRTYNGAFVVISHDRYFLDRITTRTFELENGGFTAYKGGYTDYLAQKDEDDTAARKKYDITRREISRLEGIVAQQRQWNREKNIKTAESKLKVIAKLESTLERPDEHPDSLRFDFSVRERGGNDVLVAEELALSFDGRPLFKNANIELHRGERVFLIGPNGCGKTSLLKTLLGINHADSGNFFFGANINVGYYDQIQSGLNDEKTVLDQIWDIYPRMTQTEIRNALAVFLFKGDDVFKSIKALSGGEKARVLLLTLMLSRDNFLLLDEPTNHLDIGSCEALEDALQSYEGSLLVVSHDRYLMNKLADKILFLNENGITEYIGNYDDFAAARAQEKQEEIEAAPQKSNDYRLQKERDAALRKDRRTLEKLETLIEETETEISAAELELCKPEISADYEATMALTQTLERLQVQSDDLFAQWTALSEKLEGTP